MAIDYEKFVLEEEARILGEYNRNAELKAGYAAACPNHSGEATVEAFEKASDALIGGFVAATKGL